MLDVLASADVPGSSMATSDSPTVMGYYLGEEWQDFLNSSPHFHGEALRCLAEKQDSSSKQKRFAFNPCSDIWRAADSPNASITLDCLQPSFGAGKDILAKISMVR
jgi:hypothetical protein